MRNFNLKYLAYAAIGFALFVFFLGKREPVCLLFFLLGVNFAYRAFARRRRNEPPKVAVSVEYGVLGRYDVDGLGEETSLGLYMQLLGWTVFLGIREDKFVEVRKNHALYLLENRQVLEQSLSKFMESNPEFKGRSVGNIGLHSKNLDQGEVFWDPNGYTLLKGLVFVA